MQTVQEVSKFFGVWCSSLKLTWTSRSWL